MKLGVWLPSEQMFEEEVVRIKAQAENGSFGMLPRHVDFVTALVPSVLIFQRPGQAEEYLAIDHGILVKCGPQVRLSTRNAVRGRHEQASFPAGLLPITPMTLGGHPVKTSTDPRQRLCTQCHAPNAFRQVGSADDRTPTGVHEGLSCLDCHTSHSNSAKSSCATCHPAPTPIAAWMSRRWTPLSFPPRASITFTLSPAAIATTAGCPPHAWIRRSHRGHDRQPAVHRRLCGGG